MGSCTAGKEINRGTPEGGILSPVIFNMTVEKCLKEEDKGPVEKHGYADDIAALATGIVEEAIQSNLQKELNRMEAWAASNSLSFNPSKSKIMAFLRKRNVSTYTHIFAGDVRLTVELSEVGRVSSFLPSIYK